MQVRGHAEAEQRLHVPQNALLRGDAAGFSKGSNDEREERKHAKGRMKRMGTHFLALTKPSKRVLKHHTRLVQFEFPLGLMSK
jgi:hypothetical protein